jgi:hypothetical protein
MAADAADEQVDISKQKNMAFARIRQLSGHEVGHTIGIAHKFAASEYDRESVMDYPHPLINLQNGKIGLDDAYDEGIGEWDKYVVAYGYQVYPDAKSEQQGIKFWLWMLGLMVLGINLIQICICGNSQYSLDEFCRLCLLTSCLKINRPASGLFLLASAHFLSALAYHVLD